MLANSLQELDAIRAECYAMVTQRATLSAGASALPALGVDAAADVAILLQLIPAINRRFGLAPEQISSYDPVSKQLIFQMIKRGGLALVGMEITRTLLASVLKKMAGRALGKQLLKFVPLVGWAANAAIGFGAMKYVGNSHVDDCYAVCQRLIRPAQT